MNGPAFHVVVAAYRAERWIGRCLASIQRQTRSDFRCWVRDDQSPDATLERARAAVAGDERFRIDRAEPKAWALGNRVALVRGSGARPQDVFVVVDGDDWLAHRRVLERLAEVYADPGVWLTWGSHQRWKDRLLHRIGWTRRRGIAAPYPEDVVRRRAYREHPFLASHLRTFRRFLHDALRDEDLRDEHGSYYRVGGDVADTLPMLEMAGPEHARYLDEILYVYNGSNELSDHRVHLEAQLAVDRRVRAAPPYRPLERPAPAVSP